MKRCKIYTDRGDCWKEWVHVVDMYSWQEPKELIVVHKKEWNPKLRAYVDRYALDGIFEYEFREGFLWTKKCIKTRRLRFFEDPWGKERNCFSSKPPYGGKEWFLSRNELLQMYTQWHEDVFEHPELFEDINVENL